MNSKTTTASFDLFIGIDQTGAIDSKGRPKKLPVCAIHKRKVILNQTLPALTQEGLKNFIHNHLGFSIEDVKTLICVDAVLTLPKDLAISHQQILKKIKKHSFQNKHYGAICAHHFFNSLSSNNKNHLRLIEEILGANSVFNLKPYQRNVGCGSYRILKDLSNNPGWYQLWPIEKNNKPITICEGYPSYYWQNFYALPKRHLDSIKKMTQMDFKNQDFADSYILALAAQKLSHQVTKAKLPQVSEIEGWVLGVDQ